MKCLLPTCDLPGDSHYAGCCSVAHRKEAFIVARNRGLEQLRIEAYVETAAIAGENHRAELIDNAVGMMPRLNFGGATFDRAKDGDRLTGQLANVYRLMRDGRWRTLNEIAESIGACSEAGVSARLRDLRKPKFGGWTVLRQRRYGGGLWEYRMETQ